MAGPVEMPHGPCPAAHHRPSTPGWGRSAAARRATAAAHRRARATGGPAPERRGRRPRRASRTARPTACGVGLLAQERRSHRGDPPAVTSAEDRRGRGHVGHRLHAHLLDDVRGGTSIRISTTTPHTGPIGRQARVGSITSGVHGPAATSTAPAGRRSPPASTPCTPPPHGPRPGRRALAERAPGAAGALGEARAWPPPGAPATRSRGGRPRARAASAGSSTAARRVEQRRLELREVAARCRPPAAPARAGRAASISTPAGVRGQVEARRARGSGAASRSGARPGPGRRGAGAPRVAPEAAPASAAARIARPARPPRPGTRPPRSRRSRRRRSRRREARCSDVAPAA